MTRFARPRRAARRAAAAFALTALLPAAASACSFAFIFAVRDPSLVDLIGRPTADTVEMQSGGPTYGSNPGHSGNGRRGVIHGQRVRIERLGASARRALPVDVQQVILVPWDYDASCRPVAWARSAVWAPLDSAALFRAALRPRGDWIDGVPVLDVRTADQQPYDPERLTRRRRQPENARSPLSADEMLTLLDLLPRRTAAMDTSTELRWLAQLAGMPELLGRPPVGDFIRYAQWTLQDARTDAHPLPTRGLYAVTATFPDGGARRFFLQSEGRSSGALAIDDGTGSIAVPVPLPDPLGLNLGYVIALDVGELSPCSAAAHYGGIGEIVWSPAVLPDGRRSWDASMQRDFLSLVLTQSEAQQISAAERAVGRPIAPPTEPYVYHPTFTLRFISSADGRMTLEGILPLAGLGDVRITGERLGLDTRDKDRECLASPPS